MLNKVQLIGYLGAAPEIFSISEGKYKYVANFNLATSETWRDKAGERQEKTEWHSIVIYGKLAEVAGEYLKKGSLVFLEGKIQTRSWEKDGVTHYKTEIIADNMKMLPNGKNSAQEPVDSPVPAPVAKRGNVASNAQRPAFVHEPF
jgi:single-strand DNA-binding protein